MTTNVPVNNSSHLIVSIVVVHRCQGTASSHCTSGKWDLNVNAECCTHNTEAEKLGLEQRQLASQLQQEDSMTSAICRSLSCPHVVFQ